MYFSLGYVHAIFCFCFFFFFILSTLSDGFWVTAIAAVPYASYKMHRMRQEKKDDVHHVLFIHNCIEYVCTRHLNKCERKKRLFVHQVNIKMKFFFHELACKHNKKKCIIPLRTRALSHVHTHTHSRSRYIPDNSFYSIWFGLVSFNAHEVADTKAKSKRS